MFRSIPVLNKLCFQREHERRIRQHEETVRSMKKMVDNEQPAQFGFLQSRKKKDAMTSPKNFAIDLENKVLINKLTQIVNRSGGGGGSSNILSLSQPPLMGSRMTATLHQDSNQQQKAINSMNQPLRKREFIKIVQENDAMLRRIQKTKSEYNVRKWEDQRIKNERYISSISEFPYKNFKPNKTLVKLGVWQDVNLQQASSAKTPRSGGKLQPLMTNSERSKKNTLYKKTKQIGSQTYLVEILLHNGAMKIHLENVFKKAIAFTIEMSELEGMHIFQQECDSDAEKMLERILIDEKSITAHFKKLNTQENPRKEELVKNNPEQGEKKENEKDQEEQHKVESEQLKEKQTEFREESTNKLTEPVEVHEPSDFTRFQEVKIYQKAEEVNSEEVKKEEQEPAKQ